MSLEEINLLMMINKVQKMKNKKIKSFKDKFNRLINNLDTSLKIEMGNNYSYSISKLLDLNTLSLQDNSYLVKLHGKNYLIGSFASSNDSGDNLNWSCEDCVSRIIFKYYVDTGLGYLHCEGYGKTLLPEF